ncbi:Mitochondrial import inner membrane translocase subunit TIM14-3 [Spatholobus suberectus]|nr:Mitochondrial import inner membrane translocase subunit TIM14-3 [Spatholobus suberectus]
MIPSHAARSEVYVLPNDIFSGRERTPKDKVKVARWRMMVANHPDQDAGGSHNLASKINEAKDVLLGKTNQHFEAGSGL